MGSMEVTEKIFARDENGRYKIESPLKGDEIVALAESILRERVLHGDMIDSPKVMRQWLLTRISEKEHEVFFVIYLDNRHRVIAFEELFRGTIDGTSVHVREIVKRVLHQNAAAVVVAHNHPSGDPEPSDADCRLTRRIKDALSLIEVRLLDHIVVGGSVALSLAERGLI